MASSGLVLMLVPLAFLLAVGVRAMRDFPEVQGVRDASTLREFDHARTEGIHANIFKNALMEFQAQTHMVPDENVKAKIAKALKEYQAKSFPQEADDMKMEFATKMQKMEKTDDTTVSAAVMPEKNTDSQCSTNNNSAPPPPSPNPTSTGKQSCPCNNGSEGTNIPTNGFDICFCPRPKNGGGKVGTEAEAAAAAAAQNTVGTFGNEGDLTKEVQIQPHY